MKSPQRKSVRNTSKTPPIHVNDLEVFAKKNLGQNFLFDEGVLRQIVDYAEILPDETVLEIGPGLGTLTKVVMEKAGQVIAVEFDEELARDLKKNIMRHSGTDEKSFQNQKDPSAEFTPESDPGLGMTKSIRDDDNLQIINADFLQFDLNTLPKNYKVIANIPYNITAKIVQKLLTADNPPQKIVLLVQKEVAERLAARPGNMSVLAISAQLFSEVSLGIVVPAKFFTPPPKVDSQVVIMKVFNCHSGLDPESPTYQENNVAAKILRQVYDDDSEKLFFRLVKAGFSARRKKLRTSLAGGLNLSKPDAEKILREANIDPNLRAQDLSLENWANLTDVYKNS